MEIITLKVLNDLINKMETCIDTQTGYMQENFDIHSTVSHVIIDNSIKSSLMYR